MTIQAGFEPGSVDEVINQFYVQRKYKGQGHYSLWNPQKHQPIKNMRSDGDIRHRQLRKLIAEVEAQARRNNHADSNFDPQSITSELGGSGS